MKLHQKCSSRLATWAVAAIISAIVMAFGAKAIGQTTYYWSSSAATSGNWNGSFWYNTSDSQNETLSGSERINFDNTAFPTMVNNASAANRWGIDFLSGSAARTISGSTVNTFYDYSSQAPFIQNDSGLTQTINFPIVDGNANGANALNLIANSGNLVFGGTVSASGGARTLFPQGAANLTFNGAINDGSGAAVTVTKLGAGTMSYETANNYSGNTYISAGTLQIDSSGSAANSTIQLGDSASTGASATFTLGATGGGQSLANTINVRSGSSGAKVFTSLANTGSNTLSGTITASDNFGANSTAGGNLVFSGAVKSDGTTVRTLTTLTGTGTTILQGTSDNSYLQATIGSGTLVLNKGSDSSHHALGGATETVNSGGTLQLSGTGGDQIQDGASVAVSSGGAFDLNGQTEAISSITLNGTGIGGAGALTNSSSSAATLTLNNGSLLGSATTIGGNGNITINGSGAITNASSITYLTKVGTNTITLANGSGLDNFFVHLIVNSGTVVLAKTNTTQSPSVHASGQVTINTGATVQLGGSGGYEIFDGQNSTNLGGVLDLNGQNQTFTGSGSLTLNGTGISNGGALINSSGTASTIGGTNTAGVILLGSNSSVGGSGNLTIAGVISGSGFGLTKVGGGTLTLSSNNTYTGNTIISTGTLALGATGTLPAATTVNLNGGTLAMGTFNNTVNALQSIGSVLAKGTWGASGSGANHISASMTGTGILTVSTGGASTSVVTSSANPSTYGNSVTLTNTVTGSGGDGSAPSGPVTFFDGVTSLGAGTFLSSSGTVSKYTLAISSLTAATHSITASYAGNASYDGSPLSSALSQVVNQATSTATLAVNNSPVTYNGTGQAATVGITASNTAGTVTGILAGGQALQTNTGTYSVTATFVPNNTNYTTLTGLSAGTFTINQATSTATLAVNNSPVTYNSTGQAATVGITASNTAGTVTGILAGGQTLQTNTGTYSVTANFVPNNTNYSTLTGLSAGTFTINQATSTATLAVNNPTVTYNGAGQAATVGITASNTAGTVTGILTGGQTLQTNTGTYSVTANFVPNNTNYTTLTGLSAGTFTINPATPVISWSNPSDIPYGTALSGTQLNATSGGVAGAFVYTPASGTVLGAGNAQTLSAQFTPTDTNNYSTPALKTVSINVDPASLTITASAQNKSYGTLLALGTSAFTVSGLTNGDSVSSVTLTSSGATNTATIGSYAIAVTNALGSGLTNYSISYVSGTLTVNPLVAALAGMRAYDGTTNAAGTDLTVTNVANGDVVTLSGTGGLAGADVGTNAITSFGSLTLLGAGTNYTLAGATGLMVITNTPLTITANNDGKTYDGNGYSGGNGVTYAGFVNGETNTALTGSLSYGGSAQGATNAGTYSITPAGYGSTNYLISYVDGTLTVSQLAVTVTANPQMKVYGSADPALTYGFSPALVVGDSFGGSLSRVPGEGVGSYSITQGSLNLSANYNLTYVGTNLTITLAPLTITANSTNKAYGQNLVFAGTEFTAAGLTNGDTVSSVTLTSSGATNTATVGSYSIVAASATGSSGLTNYSIGYSNGTLTVTQATAANVLASSENPSGYRDAVTFTNTLNADATGYVLFSTNSVLWSSNNLSAGLAISLSITNLPRGTNVITAAYSGDTNYLGGSISLNQIVTNHPPVANGNTYSRNSSNTWKIYISDLLTNATDVDGDTFTLVSVGTSTNGVTLDTNSFPGMVAYYNPNPVDDQFSYTVSDGFGGTSTANITLTYLNTNGVVGTNSIVKIVHGNPTVLTAYGVPGYSYIAQRSTNLLSGWVSISTNTAATTNGVITVSDYFSDLGSNAPSAAYYRLKWQ